MSIRDAIIEAMSRIDVEGGDPDTVWLHPRDKATLVKELEGKSYYMKETSAGIKGSDATVGAWGDASSSALHTTAQARR